MTYRPSTEEMRQMTIAVETIAAKVLRKYPTFDRDDLISEGYFALTLILERYDPNRDATLWSYAQHRIYGAMLDFIRSESRRSARHEGTPIDEMPWIPAEEDTDRRDIRLAVDCLESDEQRDVLSRRLEGETFDEIAARKGKTRDAARRLYCNGVERLKAKGASPTDI